MQCSAPQWFIDLVKSRWPEPFRANGFFRIDDRCGNGNTLRVAAGCARYFSGALVQRQ